MSHSNRILFTSTYNSIRYRRFFDIIESMNKFITELQMKFPLIYFKGQMQKLFNCKGWKIIWSSGNRIVLSILFMKFLLIKCEISYSNHTTSFTLSHNSIRHRRYFDIIESMCNLTTRLQMESLLMYFRNWVQKLFNCKG